MAVKSEQRFSNKLASYWAQNSNHFEIKMHNLKAELNILTLTLCTVNLVETFTLYICRHSTFRKFAYDFFVFERSLFFFNTF